MLVLIHRFTKLIFPGSSPHGDRFKYHDNITIVIIFVMGISKYIQKDGGYHMIKIHVNKKRTVTKI